MYLGPFHDVFVPNIAGQYRLDFFYIMIFQVIVSKIVILIEGGTLSMT
jgi:hypothetical protein